jgi:hypothetical protein
LAREPAEAYVDEVVLKAFAHARQQNYREDAQDKNMRPLPFHPKSPVP